MKKNGVFVFFCGKMGAGKSTLAKQIAKEMDAILLSEDEWMSAIFPDEIKTFKDYLKYSPRLKSILTKHVKDMLKKGTSVVMDFPGNTVEQRNWFREIFFADQIPHKLIYLDVEDSQCLEHLKKRRQEDPSRSNFDTEKVFHEVSRHFIAPSPSEGFNIEVIKTTP